MARDLRPLALALALVLGSCGGGSNSTPTSPSTTTPPASPTVSSVTVTGPATSPRVGESAQFTATAVMSNGTSQAITNQASWQSSNAGVATVSTSGLVTAVAPGDVEIRATYQSMSGSARVTVIQPIFKLCGNVREESSSGLSGAQVRFSDGANAGKSATTSSGGDYCINDALPGGFNVTASLTNYTSQTLEVSISGDTTLNFSLRRVSAPPSPPPPPTTGTCNGEAIPSNARCLNNGTPPVTAVCNDGAYSCSQNRSGSCSTHGGVKCWVCPGVLCNGAAAASVSQSIVPSAHWLNGTR